MGEAKAGLVSRNRAGKGVRKIRAITLKIIIKVKKNCLLGPLIIKRIVRGEIKKQ